MLYKNKLWYKEIDINKKMEQYILKNGKKFFIHPVYKKYAANDEGEIMNIRLRNPRKGYLSNRGYLKCVITTEESKIKNYFSHRFVFECFYGLIEKGKQINHINSIKVDNRLKNLEVVTPSENVRKSTVNKDCTFLKDIRKNPRRVKVINLITKAESNFKSLYSVSKMLGINSGQVKMICDGRKNFKTATSKINGQKYTFRYI